MQARQRIFPINKSKGMGRDFDHPQRQSPVGILIEFADTLQRSIRSFWPLLLYGAIRFDEINLLWAGLGGLLVIVIISVIAYFKYLNFMFHIDHVRGEFILSQGIFNKKQVVVQLSKIQQVNINQNFIQKLAQVYAVHVETAGSTEVEVKIKAISRASAMDLKERLLESSPQDIGVTTIFEAADGPAPTQSPLIKIGVGSLAKVGITSNYVESFMVLLAFLYTVYNNIKDIWWSGEGEESRLQEIIGSMVFAQGLFLLFGILMAITFLINLIRTVIPYFDFSIYRQGNSLMISYGLINSNNIILHPRKVQIVKLTSNYFQKKMDLYRMVVRQASSNIHKDRKASIRIPGCNQVERDTILRFVFDELPKKGEVMKPNFRWMMASAYKLILFPFLIVGTLMWFWPALYSYLPLVPLYFILLTFLIYMGYRNNRLYVQQGFIIKQKGIWDIQTEIIEPHKIQAISTEQKLWHKRSNIGHLVLHTAGGDISFRFGDYSKIQELADYWLYQVESSSDEWM